MSIPIITNKDNFISKLGFENEDYLRGMIDLWDALMKIKDIPFNDCEQFFGMNQDRMVCLDHLVIHYNSPQMFMRKMEEYEYVKKKEEEESEWIKKL